MVRGMRQGVVVMVMKRINVQRIAPARCEGTAHIGIIAQDCSIFLTRIRKSKDYQKGKQQEIFHKKNDN